MKYSAIQFLQKKLTEDSHCLVCVGNNRWLKKQIRKTIEKVFGQSITVSALEEDAIRDVANIVTSKPLDPKTKTFICLTNFDQDLFLKWIENIEIIPKGMFLLVSFNEKKEDKRVYQTQLKNLLKFDKSTIISSVDLQNPSDQITLMIIQQLLSANGVIDKKYEKWFFDRYGSDFDLVEENAKKLKANGKLDVSIIDKKDTSIKDVWLVADKWIEGEIKHAIELLGELEKAGIKSFAVQSQLASQFRQHIIAAETGRGHPYIVNRSLKRSQEWLISTYQHILKLDPIKTSYFDAAKLAIVSTFISLKI